MRGARVFQPLSFAVIAAWLLCSQAAAARLQVIHSFTGPDGVDPTGGVVADNKGVLYGTTPFGGAAGAGTVFSLTPPKKGKHKWKFKTLYSFQGGTDGQRPFTGLARDHNGVLYGTFYEGFSCNGTGCGGVFTLTPPAEAGGSWTKTTIFQFSANDGFHPLSTPVLDAAGALYGTTGNGPGGAAGIVYLLFPPASGRGMWKEFVVYDGRAVTGGFVHPMGIAVDENGNVFGTAADGDAGVVFEVVDGTAEVLLPFGGDGLGGVTPLVPPVLDVLGNLYGTTIHGGDPSLCPNSPGCGTVWQLRPASDMSFWTEEVLHKFAFFTDNTDGQGPGDGAPFPAAFSPLLLDSKTLTLYGSTFYGGTGTQCGGIGGSCGTLFKMDFGGNYSVLWEFPDGGAAAPEGQLAVFKGALYGTTYDGGMKCGAQHYLGCGTVWKLTP